MPDQIQQITASLPEMKNFGEVFEIADHHLQTGETSFLGDLGVALIERFERGEWVSQYRGVLDHLLRLLTVVPGQGDPLQALRLLEATRAGGRELERYTACLLAENQPAAELAETLYGADAPAHAAAQELRACLVHELALRGATVRELPHLATWTASPLWRRHPLGVLPLELCAFEQNPNLPTYGLRSSSHQNPFGPSYDRDQPAPTPGPVAVPAAELTTAALAAQISTAVQNWARRSGDKTEARVFEFPEPLSAQALPAALLGADLACLREREATSAFTVTSTTAGQAWRVLFAAACNGGAYIRGDFGAYGRLYAWRSLAALAAAGDDTEPAATAEQVQQCSWYRFGADTPWFEQVAWDIGIASLDPDRTRLAVLAATDTD